MGRVGGPGVALTTPWWPVRLSPWWQQHLRLLAKHPVPFSLQWMLSVSNLTCKIVSDTCRNERYLKGILVVNFMCHVHKRTQMFAQTLFWIYL